MAFALAAGLAGSAAISGGSSLLGGLLNSGASKQASQQQQQAQMQNLAFQTGLLGINQTNFAPFMQSGWNATGTLNKLLTPGADQESTLENLPGFKFQSKWGTKTAQNALSAEGLGGSTGPLSQAISNYNNGLASTSYGNFVSQLQAQEGLGINAASGIGGATNSASGGVSNALTAGGNAAAAGTLGSANALSGGLFSAAGSSSNALLFQSLLNGSNNANSVSGIFGNIPDNAFDNFS